jgi:aspartate/methionine/tyrosine aminotransferase
VNGATDFTSVVASKRLVRLHDGRKVRRYIHEKVSSLCIMEDFMSTSGFQLTNPQTFATLTDHERNALSGRFNLADGHARYSISQNYSALLEKLPPLLTRSYDQDEAEYDFGKAFFGLGGQTLPERERTLYCPSASISIELAANYLRMKHLSVSLIEPIFDNLADCIRRHDVPLQPLKEEFLYENDTSNWHKAIDTDAIFLVLPNNPTGYLLSPAFFSQIIDFCVKEDKLLLLDFSFRFFIPELQVWDQYKALEQSGVRYIAFEDTGKTWPTFEIKVSPLVADKQTFTALQRIYLDIFICHSPLALTLVGEFVKTSQQEGSLKSFQSIITKNRTLLRTTLANTPLKPLSNSIVSVEWVYIEDTINDIELVKILHEYGIYILTGKQFFWSQKQSSSKFVRIALMRDTDLFAQGMRVLQNNLAAIFKNA